MRKPRRTKLFSLKTFLPLRSQPEIRLVMKKYSLVITFFMITSAFATPSIVAISQLPLNASYINYKFGLSIRYPKKLDLSSKFATSYFLDNGWSAGVTPVQDPKKSGKYKLTEITLYTNSADKWNSAYYTVTVRIGASKNPKDLQSCYSTHGNSIGLVYGMSYKPFKLGINWINGRKFIALPMTNGFGMNQFFDGVSFRTKANGYCYAIEYIETGGHADYQQYQKDYAALVKPYKQLAKRIIDTVNIQTLNL